MPQQVQQLQAVARRLEKMLETALNQLKLEQKMRKEGDNKLIELQLGLVNAEHALAAAEEAHGEALVGKEGEVRALQDRVATLEEQLQGKGEEEEEDEEVVELVDGPTASLQQTAEKFEDRLKLLLDVDKDTEVMEETGGNYDEVEMDDLGGEVEQEVTLKEERFEEVDPRSISRCAACGDEFPSGRELTEHQKATGHGYSLACAICERKFKTKYTLKSHEEMVHNDKKPFKCGKCDQRFKDEGSMRRHQANDRLHQRLDRERASPDLICNICGKKFPRKRRWCLDQHLLTHLETRRFACTACGKEFPKRTLLDKHKGECHPLKQEPE